jgi:hypothetical protein
MARTIEPKDLKGLASHSGILISALYSTHNPYTVRLYKGKYFLSLSILVSQIGKAKVACVYTAVLDSKEGWQTISDLNFDLNKMKMAV